MEPKRGPGRPRRLGPTTAFSVRLDADLFSQFRVVAAARGVSMNDLLRLAAREWLESQPERALVAKIAKTAKSKSAKN